MPDDAALNINATGSGTFDNPSIKIDGKLSGGTFKAQTAWRRRHKCLY